MGLWALWPSAWLVKAHEPLGWLVISIKLNFIRLVRKIKQELVSRRATSRASVPLEEEWILSHVQLVSVSILLRMPPKRPTPKNKLRDLQSLHHACRCRLGSVRCSSGPFALSSRPHLHLLPLALPRSLARFHAVLTAARRDHPLCARRLLPLADYCRRPHRPLAASCAGRLLPSPT